MNAATLVLILSVTSLSLAENSSCYHSLINLENALFARGKNLLNMENAFFPTVEQKSRFLRVVYHFGEKENNCTVVFFWSVGSFLFIQPPAVFTYTSLLFNFPANSIDNVTITFPDECRPLVNNNNNDDNNDACTCRHKGITFLDMLTRHLQDYSKVSCPSSVTRNDKTSVRIICGDELRKSYYDNSGVILFFSMILVLPVGLLIMVALYVQSKRKELERKCMEPSNHGNVAGVILTGLFVMLFIICLDMIAVFNVLTHSHEYKTNNIEGTFNLYVVLVTAALDLLAMFYSVMAWFLFVSWTGTYVAGQCKCCHMEKCKSCLKITLKCLFAPYLYLVFGYKKHDKFWDEKRDEDSKVADSVFAVRQVWALLSLMIGPLMGIFTHVCYILVAWLTEPQKTSSVFVFVLVFLVYLFTVFRAVYKSRGSPMTSVNNNVPTRKRVKNYFKSFFQCCIVCGANFGCDCKGLEPDSIDLTTEYKNEFKLLSLDQSPERKMSNNVIIFSKGRLFSSFLTGNIATIPLIVSILAFTYIPIPSLELANYLRHVIEIGIVLFAALATHRIFSFKEPDMNLLIRKFKEKYKTKKPLSDNLFEACGEIAGEVCHTINTKQGYPMILSTQASVTSNGTRLPDTMETEIMTVPV